MTVAGETSEALPRSERLLTRRDFLTAQARGRRLHGEHFVVLLRARDDDGPARIGATVSRKVGNSVVRHRIKRWIREVFRRNKSVFPRGVDVVVIARESKVPGSLAIVRDELLSLMTAPRGRSGRAEGRRPNPRGSQGPSVDRAPPGPSKDAGRATEPSQPRGGTGARARTDAQHRSR